MEHMLHLIGAEQNPCDEETIISLREIIRQIGHAKHQLPRQRDAASPSAWLPHCRRSRSAPSTSEPTVCWICWSLRR